MSMYASGGDHVRARTGVIPNTHSMTDLSESHGTPQIEVPNIANTNNAMYAKRCFP